MSKKKCLVTGASGLLGYHLVSHLVCQDFAVQALVHHHSLDIKGNIDVIQANLLETAQLELLIIDLKPDVIIHCAGLTDVNQCEKQPDLARRIHIDASAVIARVAHQIGARLIHISTDQLWDGTQSWVKEDTPTCPLNVYGQTKALGEQAVLKNYADALVVRTNFFGKGLTWRPSFSDWLDRNFSDDNGFTAFTDVHFTPLEVGHLCDVLIRLIHLNATGIIHIAGSERLSKYDFACRYANYFGYEISKVYAGCVEDMAMAAPRPHDMSLNTERVKGLLGAPMANIVASFERLASNS